MRTIKISGSFKDSSIIYYFVMWSSCCNRSLFATALTVRRKTVLSILTARHRTATVRTASLDRFFISGYRFDDATKEFDDRSTAGLSSRYGPQRLFSGRNYRESKKKTNNTPKLRNVLPHPPGEKQVESKFPLPDKDKEQELGRMQSQVMDLHRSGHYKKALTVANELLDHTQSHFGRLHPATAAAYMNAGLMRKLLGDFDAARADYTTAQSIYQETVGNDHASYASTLHNLGALNRTQIHVDSTLSATDRLGLVESALQYLQQAHAIRLAELGPEHPHTVASRSSWGATLAARVLHHHKVTSDATTSTESSGATNADTTNTTTMRDLVQRRFYISLLPTDITETAWDAAEEHLRQAYETALANPRGMTVAKKAQASSALPNATKFPPNQLQRLKKKSPSVAGGVDKTVDLSSPQTLSAAAAAQNLAVFLKARATTVPQKLPHHDEWLTEAEDLYRKVLSVQDVLLSSTDDGQQHHPDRYVTLHSLAELLDLKGDVDAAKALRQEMVDSYDPASMTAPDEEPTSNPKEVTKVDP